LRTALGERIENLDWMSEETKVNAKEKLMAFNPKIGYPDEWQSFDGVTISEKNLVGNVRNLRTFFQDQSVERELEKTDRNRWGMTPQRVIMPTTIARSMKLYSQRLFCNHHSLIQTPTQRLTTVQSVR